MGSARETAAEAAPKVTVRAILADPSVRVVIITTFVVMLGFGIIAPILPLYARSFGVGYDAAGLLISSFAFTRLLFDMVAGPIIDRYGERMAATGGLLIVTVSSILTGLAWNFPLAVIFRGAGGAGSSIMFAAVYSYMLKVVPKDRMARTLGVFFGSFNIGFIAGGPVGGLIAHVGGLRSPLFVYAGLCVAAAGLFHRLIRNPPAPEESAEERAVSGEGNALARTWRDARTLLASRTFLAVVVLNMAFFWVIAGGYDTLVPLFGQSALGMSTVGIGAVLAVAVATEFMLLYPSGAWADRHGRKALAVPALVYFALVLCGVGFATSALTFALALGLIGIGSGSVAVAPSAMLSDVVPERSGTAVGVFRFFGDIGFVLGPLVAGASASVFGFKAAFAVLALPLLLSLGLLLSVRETMVRRPGGGSADALAAPRTPDH